MSEQTLLEWLGPLAPPSPKPGESAAVCRGLSVRRNIRNPFLVVTLRYEADPEKDPLNESGRQWLLREQQDMGCHRICRTCDKLWAVADETCPDCADETELVLSNRWRREYEIDYGAQSGSYVFDAFSRSRNVTKPFRIPASWRRWRALDHGFRNPTACYDDQTEILTENGWKLFKDVTPGELVATMRPDHVLEFQQPVRSIAYRYTGDLLVVEDEAINFAVTPDHRMVYNPRAYANSYTIKRTGERRGQEAQNRVEFAVCDDLPRVAHIPMAPLPAERMDGPASLFSLPDLHERGRGCRSTALPAVRRTDFAEFLGWFIAEGTVSTSGAKNPNSWGKNYLVKIAQKKHLDRLRQTLDALGWTYHEYVRPDGVVVFHISSRQLWAYLKRNVCGSFKGAKRIPREVLGWGTDSLSALFEALMLGDGHRSRVENGAKQSGDCYCTVDPGLADDVQELATRLGFASRIRVERRSRGNRRPLYKVALHQARYSHLHRAKVRRRAYDGMVYCLTVPNGTLVVRRHARPMICGNCLWIAVDPDRNAWVYAEHYEAGQTTDHHAREIHKKTQQVDGHVFNITPSDLRLQELVGWEPTKEFLKKSAMTYQTLGDPSMANRTAGEAKTIQQRYSDHGIFVAKANRSWAGLETINAMFSAGTLTIFEPCENLIREIENLVWAEHSDPARNKKEVPVDRNDHATDCLRYWANAFAPPAREGETPQAPAITSDERAAEDRRRFQERHERPATHDDILEF